MKLFNSKPTSLYEISVALKSSSVDIQLIRISQAGSREVVLAQRKIILLNNSQDPQLYTDQCISELSILLKSVAKDIQQLSQGCISKIMIILYAPWFTSNITPINHKENVTLSEKFLNEQLKTIKTPKQLICLEKKVVKILTNGYPVTELSQSKFNNISIGVYSSYISRQIHETINTTVAEALPASKKIIYITSPVMIFNQIKSFLIHEDNITFVYIGGEITEVGIIEDDSLSYFSTFPIGKHDFLREVQGEHSATYDYDLLYQKEIRIKQKVVEQRFANLQAQWFESITQSLKAFGKNVPSKILIISDSKTKDFFVNQLSKQLKTNPEGFLKQHRIINFDMSLLKDIITHNTPTLANELDLQLEALT